MASRSAALKTRYRDMPAVKAEGATYTPPSLAQFVAAKLRADGHIEERSSNPLRLLDPAVGDGELLVQLLRQLKNIERPIQVWGFDTNPNAVAVASARLREEFPNCEHRIQPLDFLNAVQGAGLGSQTSLQFSAEPLPKFDLIIANPPYVRTQVLGASSSQQLARQFGLSGRVDLYHAFLLAIAAVLHTDGHAAVIVSNRFMTTKAGSGIRTELRRLFSVRHVWDLGDTRLFDAAVLPAVLLLRAGRGEEPAHVAQFTSIYETQSPCVEVAQAQDPVQALESNGDVRVLDGRMFRVQHGLLDAGSGPDSLWRIRTDATDDWLERVQRNTWATFRDIGKIRVGVKTCADSVFIRTDWDSLVQRPELLRPLTTHHVGAQYRPREESARREILYPHAYSEGRRSVVNLERYPHSRAYLEKYRAALERRSYVLEAGREWFEIWVPQDPQAWALPKLIFRDITSEPCFWLDFSGTVVNGDCYWLTSERDRDLLWLAAAVGNSRFIEAFYDHKFNNKLYAGRRRFITQYVEQFPLPNPESRVGKQLISRAKDAYQVQTADLLAEIDALVSEAFEVN